MTRILDLPLLTFPVTIRNNEDWTDAWAYVDATSTPISLAGLTLTMMLRVNASDTAVQIIARTVSDPFNGQSVNGLIVTGGAGLNVVALSIPESTVVSLAPGVYIFEMQAAGDGHARNIATGPVTVEQGIVR